MTDEEMALEWISKYVGQSVEVIKTVQLSFYKNLEKAYLAGLKLGKPKWHDLRKDSKDLPKEDNWYQVSVYSQITGNKKSGLYTTTAFYDTDKNEWQTKDYGYCQRDDWMNDNIRAWCEQLKFEE